MKLLPSLKQLEYLVALIDTGHFGQAAGKCNVTPSTLSAGIKDLEDILGVAVAERTKRTVLITSIGREIAARARQILVDAEDVVALAASHTSRMSGEIKLGAIPTISPFVLPRVLPGIEAQYPDLRIYLREEQTAPLLSRLRDGDLDLALIALPFDTTGLASSTLYEDEFVFACPASHPLADRTLIEDRDLLDLPLLLLEEGHCLRGHALEACRLQPGRIRVQFEATSLQTLVQMVASGLGVTLLPKMAVSAGLASIESIRLIPLAVPAFRQIGLVWRASSPRQEDFRTLSQLFTDFR